jgi:hypothetical protein
MNVAIWQNETIAAMNIAMGGAPAYMTQAQQLRWERLRQSRMLFESRHRDYFLQQGRTQHDYPFAEVNGQIVQPYLTVNLLRLMSVKTADLLFGVKARFTAETRTQIDYLDDLARRSMLHSRLHQAVVAASWSGGAYLEAVMYGGESFITVPEPDEIYPVGQCRPDGQYERYVRFATQNIGTSEKPLIVLLESTYEPGAIERRLWQLNDKGARERELQLQNWPEFAAAPKPARELLGTNDNAITFLPNEVGGRIELSDYDGLVSLQDTINAKFMQVARVIAKHADPILSAPEWAGRSDGNLSARAKVFFRRSKDDAPEYHVWDANMEAAIRDRAAAVNVFGVVAEFSPALLGMKEGATPESARKLKLDLTNTLAKVGRKALVLEMPVATAIEKAQRLDQTSALRRSYPVGPIGTEYRDGLPVDELDEATIISTLTGGKPTMSIESAVERRVEDPDAVATELSRLERERAAAVPSVLFGESGEQPAIEPEDEDEEETTTTREAA